MRYISCIIQYFIDLNDFPYYGVPKIINDPERNIYKIVNDLKE